MENRNNNITFGTDGEVSITLDAVSGKILVLGIIIILIVLAYKNKKDRNKSDAEFTYVN